MSDLEIASLWRLSAFESQRTAAASSAHAPLRRQTQLSTTLQDELRLLDRRRDGSDALETVAACMRLRESALLYLQHDNHAWPVTLYPTQMLYHSPRSLLRGTRRGMAGLRTIDIEPAGVQPPGHWMHERIGRAEHYHPLMPALWALALQGPRATLLQELSGPAAFRALRSPSGPELRTPGALGPAIERLRKTTTPVHQIARWPGMSVERANRLLNGLYLTSNLIISRTHHSAQPGVLDWLFKRLGA
jgi:hypothetical protein